MRSLKWALISMTVVLTKMGGWPQRQEHTHRRPQEHDGRDGVMLSISQGMPKIVSKPSGARREAWNRFSLTAFRKKQPCRPFDLRPPASRTVRPQMSLF